MGRTDPVAQRRIEETGLVGFNPVRTAGAVHVHRDTVVHRTNRTEQITSRPLRNTGRPWRSIPPAWRTG
jgi:hypothetical protein